MVTFREIIRVRGDQHLRLKQADLTDRQRRYVGLSLNTASNAGWACVAYPPSDQTRDDVIKELVAHSWDMRILLTHVETADFAVALDRAIAILREL